MTFSLATDRLNSIDFTQSKQVHSHEAPIPESVLRTLNNNTRMHSVSKHPR